MPTEKGLMVPSVPPAASPSASASPYPSSNSSNNGPKQSPTPEAPLPSAGDPLKDLPHDPLLDSVEEKGHTLKSYRLKKAQEILGVEQRKPPEKDW